MPNTVFYSWQQDTPQEFGESFIEKALSAALKELHADITLDKALRDLQLDRDTKNIPGQPAIADTILRKIDDAAVFVPDLTFVGERLDKKRLIPNPNVLIEYGYAVKALTHERIVPVMNTYYGEPSDATLPFDMKHLRHPIQYRLGPETNPAERARIFAELTANLKEYISAVLKKFPAPPSAKPFNRHASGARIGSFRSAGQPIGVNDDYSPRGNGKRAITLTEGPVVWLRLSPTFDLGRTWRVTEIAEKVNARISSLTPLLTSDSMGYVRSTDGFGIFNLSSGNQPTTRSTTFVFTSGEVWAVSSNAVALIEYRGRIVIRPMTRLFSERLKSYSEFLISLGVPPPFQWFAGIEGTQNLPTITDGLVPGMNSLSPDCLEAMIFAQGAYNPDDDPIVALRPFTIKFYDSCGLQPPSDMLNSTR
ncbi:MAG TPA: hypothetical protein VJS89_00585 [Gammaproteobacteria bacterium]|nr:hypothetical protein [Gammaproteobacteria bacterium]